MIRKVLKNDLDECVKVIRSSFQTVADEFGFTEDNAPRFTAFATTLERLLYHYEQEKRPMFVYQNDDGIVGYYSLWKQNGAEHTGTEKYDFFPFTCGYMRMKIGG
ncbi:MAG: hypothetical protein HDR15_07925 [Lachnospiraceae bacterium]|nr:hypothetical protein [Lachnospiraceae bacterium]